MLKAIHGIVDMDGADSGIRDTDKVEGRRGVIWADRSPPSFP